MGGTSVGEPGGARDPGIWRVTLLFVGLTLVLTYPLSVNPASTAFLGPDNDLFKWTLAWDVHAFLHQPFAFFDANMYFPESLTLAYSENVIGSALIAAPVLWLTGNPVLALNVVLLLSVVLCGLGAYVLARRSGVGVLGAVLCGLVFAFSPARFYRIGQLHVMTVQWVPFGLASLLAYLDGGRRRDLRLVAALFTLQTLTTGHGGVFYAVGVILLLAYRVMLGEPLRLVTRARDLGVTGLLLLMPAVLILVPYRLVQSRFEINPSLENWIVSSTSYLASPAHVPSFVWSLFPEARINETADAYLFPGFLPVLFVAAALAWRPLAALGGLTWPRLGWRHLAVLLEVAVALAVLAILAVTVLGPIRIRVDFVDLLSISNTQRAWVVLAIASALRVALRRRVPLDVGGRAARRAATIIARWARTQRRDAAGFHILLTAVAVLLAIGPPLSLWPFVYWIPPLSGIRVPARFIVLAMVGFSVLVGMGFERLSARLAPDRQRIAAAVVGLLLVAEFITIPLPADPFPWVVPPADRWLAEQPTPFVVAEVPVESHRAHTIFMLHSTAHWQPLVNGYSRLRSDMHEQLFSDLRNFPDDRSIDELERLGVTYVVVHSEMEWREPDDWDAVEPRFELFQDRLTLEFEEDGGRVYSLRSTASR